MLLQVAGGNGAVRHEDFLAWLFPGGELSAVSDLRRKNVYFAKLAEQAERYDEMSNYMEAVVMVSDDLSVEERSLLAVACKHVVGSRRAAWRVATSIEDKEKTKGNDRQAGFAREYCGKLESELQKICDAILALLNERLIPKTPPGASKVFYVKMKADYHRYIAEFTTGAAKDKASEDARAAYADAAAVAEKDLVVWHPIRLGLALNYSVFMHEVLDQPDEAMKMARGALEAALAELGSIAEESYNDSTMVMQLLRDNLTLWTAEQEPGAAPDLGRARTTARQPDAVVAEQEPGAAPDLARAKTTAPQPDDVAR